MKLAYGIVRMKSTRERGGGRCVVWAYDLDRPRQQRADLPQGKVVDFVGVYDKVDDALAATEAHRENFLASNP